MIEIIEVIKWVGNHPVELMEVYVFSIGIASIIVKLTPTLKDDAILKKVIRFVGKFLAWNRK